MSSMTIGGRNVGRTRTSRIAAQNLMEGDECFLASKAHALPRPKRGDPRESVRVAHINRDEAMGVISVRFSDRKWVSFDWDERVAIVETPERHLFRRNSLRRNLYPNYMTVEALRSKVEFPVPTPKGNRKAKRKTKRSRR